MKTTYKGNPYANVRGILLILFTTSPIALFLIFGIYPIFYPEGLVFCLLISTSFYFIFSATLNYLIIDDDTIVVKNHFKPWKKRTLKLDEIEQISFDLTSGGAKALTKGIRLKFKDNYERLIFFSSFSHKLWVSIFDHFKRLNINIGEMPKTSKDYWKEAGDIIKNAGKGG